MRKTRMIISTDTEKTFDKIWQNSTTFMRKPLRELGKERKVFKLLKTICEKPATNVIFNGETQNVLSLRLETKQKCPLLPHLFNIVL